MIYEDRRRSALYHPSVATSTVYGVCRSASVQHSISLYTATTFINQKRKKDEYYLVCQALLTKKAAFAKIFRHYFLSKHV